MAFGGPRSSCVRPGAHSARRPDSHKDWTPYRMAEPSRGRRTPLVAYAPSLSCAPPMYRQRS